MITCRFGTYRFVRPGFWPALMTAVAVVTMTCLGVWQVQRLYWKLGLIETLEQAERESPRTELPDDPAQLNALIYHPVLLTGEFRNDKELHRAGRYYRNRLGYDVITPLHLADGRNVLVNRGWIPADHKDPATRPETLPQGTVQIRGTLREANIKNWFTPNNRPEKNLWFSADIPAMEQATGLALLPVTVDAVGEAKENVYPVPFPGKATLRNDHLGYAITWFGVALGCLVIFIVYHLRREEEEAS